MTPNCVRVLLASSLQAAGFLFCSIGENTVATKSTAGSMKLQIADLEAQLEEAESERDDLAEENDLLSEQLDEIFKIAAPEGAIDEDDSDDDED
jgi:cell division protein FtsB